MSLPWTHTAGARNRGRPHRRARYPWDHRTALHLSPHGSRSSEVGFREGGRPQPSRAARGVQRLTSRGDHAHVSDRWMTRGPATTGTASTAWFLSSLVG